MQRVAGQSAARREGATIAGTIASRSNAADGCPAARPQGAHRMARLGVAAFAKGITITCKPRLDPNHPEGSACGFVNEGLSKLATF